MNSYTNTSIIIRILVQMRIIIISPIQVRKITVSRKW